jgi:hypothetical protein
LSGFNDQARRRKIDCPAPKTVDSCPFGADNYPIENS